MTRGDLPLDERLERIEDKQDQMLQTQVTILVELAGQRARAGLIGAMTGILGGAVVSAVITKLLGG